EGAEAIRGHRSAALHVEERVVPGITDLTGEQAKRIDARLVGDTSDQRARIAALQIGPVALRFETEHEGAGLPAITDLTTGNAAGRIMATFRSGAGEVPAIVARTPTTVGADVETAPVIHSGDHRRRLGVRTRREI